MSNKPTTLDDAGQACVPCLIDGEPVVQPSAASFPIVSARTQQTLHYGQTATVEIATRAVESAAAAFKKYRKTNANERRHLLERAASLLEQRIPEAMERQMDETSCLEHWAQFNAYGMPLCVKEYAASVKSAVSGEITPSPSGATQLVTKEPVGPVLIIVP
jgi:acyl-CoA reductase-like NAD-dependent aldehyde dehydrogenase